MGFTNLQIYEFTDLLIFRQRGGFTFHLNALPFGAGGCISTPFPITGEGVGLGALMQIHLWEWNLDGVVVQSLVDALTDLTVADVVSDDRYPAHDDEVD